MLCGARKNNDGPIRMQLHGFDVFVNRGNIYPSILRDNRIPFFNSPLVELVQQAFSTLERRITVVDIGATIGDTVLLLKERCNHALRRIICVEGEAEFFALLDQNMRQFEDVVRIRAVLAGKAKRVRSLVKHHLGTAAAIGDEWIDAVPLDSLRPAISAPVDVLKIDVDGCDGEVLCGAAALLEQSRPAVIFEWHPKLFAATGCDPLAPFETLTSAGYGCYLWFNNRGTFSHFSGVPSRDVLQQTVDYLIAVNARCDEHFDVIAVPNGSRLNPVALAAMEYARGWQAARQL
jgi:FkbM family methyltransferase